MRATYDLSNGDLVQSLVNFVLRFDTGGAFDVTGAVRRDCVDDHEMLLPKSQARASVVVSEATVKAVFAAAEVEGVDAVRIGTAGDDMLAVSGVGPPVVESEGCGWIALTDGLRELSNTGRTYF